MTSGQKIAFSLLTAMALFAAFVLTMRSTIFKELETRYYTQSKIEEHTQQLNKISESIDSYITELLNNLEQGENAWTKEPSVRSYYLQNPSESDVNSRRVLTEQLFQKIPTLNGIRILDKNGRNVHFSTYDDTDILKQTGISKVYKNYPDIQKDADELAFEVIEKHSQKDKFQVLLDEAKDRLIISVPYYWMDNVYSGQCLFYFRWFEIEKELSVREVLSIGQKISMFSDDNFNGGFVYSLPSGNRNLYKESIFKYWKNHKTAEGKLQSPEKLLEMEDGRFWVVLSNSNNTSINLSGIYTSDIFELSNEIILLIYICVFISILLIVFLIFSFNRNPEMVLKKRIKKIQFGIIKECIEKEDKIEWAYVSRQLKSRKKDLSAEILRSLKVHSKKKRKELDAFLEQNWNEIFSIFDDKVAAVNSKGNTSNSGAVAGVGELTGASLAEIKKVVEEVLQSTKINVAAVPVQKVVVQKSDLDDEAVEEIEEIEEVDELDEADEVEEIEDAEEVDEVEEIEDAEELDEVEEIEDAEELDEVEEIEDAEEVGEVEEIEGAEEVGEAEEIEDAEELDEVEEIEDAEEVDEVEEIEDAEEVGEAEEIEDAEELDEVEEIEDAEELGEVEEIESVEELDEVEELEVLDELEEIEEIAGLEELPEPPKPIMNTAFLLMNQPVYVYKPSKDTYFASDDFATVENVHAEEMAIGTHIPLVRKALKLEDIRFKVFELYKYPENSIPEEIEDTEDVEELTEEVPEILPYYSMTGFAENLSIDTPILEAANIPEGAIFENEGIFSISDDLELKDVQQDQDFKALVDSIL